MCLPGLETLVNLLSGHLALLHQTDHAQELLSLLLDIVRIYYPDNFSCARQPVREAQELDSFFDRIDPCFLRMQLELPFV